MDDRYQPLAIEPDPAFADRLEAMLLERVRERASSVADGAPVDGAPVADAPAGPVVEILRRPSRRRRRSLLAVAAAVVLVAAGLGVAVRGRRSATFDELPSRTSALAALGTATPVSGPPVLMGFLADEEEDGAITSVEAAQAAAQYVNDHLGGIAGRPLQLAVCTTGPAADEATARACGRSFVDDGVVAVLQGRSVRGEVVGSEASVAEVPFVAFDVVDLAARATGSYQIVSEDAAGLAPALLAGQAGRRRAAVVTTAGSPESQYVPAGQEPYYAGAGVKATFTSVAADGSDAAAVARALVTAGVEQVHLMTFDPTCGPMLRALRAAGFGGPVYVNRGCLDATGVGDDLDGVVRIGAYPTDPAGPEATLFRNVLAAYTGGGAVGRFAPSGYGAVLGIARGLAGLRGEVTPAAVRAALERMAPAPVPLVDGVTFRCAAHGAPATTADCTRTVTVEELGEGGRVRRRSTLDVDAFLAAGGS